MLKILMPILPLLSFLCICEKLECATLNEVLSFPDLNFLINVH